jgi:hypothetical protein
MRTHTTNHLAEEFECDRSTMARALRNVPPDAEKIPGKPTYKVSTAALALEAHRRRTAKSSGRKADERGGYNDPDPRLQRLYDDFDAADKAMRKLPTLAKRRAAVVGTIRPIIDATQKMLFTVGKDIGQDPDMTGFVADKLYLLALRGCESPCSWSHEESWSAMNADRGDE